FQAEDGIRDFHVTGVQTCALPILTVDGIELQEGEYALVTKVEDRLGDTVAAAVLPGGGFVVLDLELDDELLGDGYARDVVRQVQDARKAAGLHVADRITLRLAVPAPWAQAVAIGRAH